MDIFTFTSPDCYRRWEGTQWMERGDEYERVRGRDGWAVLAWRAAGQGQGWGWAAGRRSHTGIPPTSNHARPA